MKWQYRKLRRALDADTGGETLASLPDLTRALDILGSDIESAQTAFDKAQSNYAQLTDRKYFSTDAGYEASFQEHLPALQQAETEARRRADNIIRQAQSILTATERGDYPSLSQSEMADASARAVFVQRECATLNLDDLAARIRYALQTNDRPALYSYLSYADERTKPGKENLGELGSEQEGAKRATLRAMLREAKERLTPDAVRKVNKQASELLGKGYSLKAKAGRRKQGERRFIFQTDRDVPWGD